MKRGAKISNLPRHGLVRLAFRLPMLFYGIHLGWLFGDRLLMLTHIGRKSGGPRSVTFEVVHHDRAAGVYTIASAWEKKADWYQNIVANPRVQVTAGSRQFAARAVPLTQEEAKIALDVYARDHPLAFRELAGYIVGLRSKDPKALVASMAASISLFDLAPEG